MKDPNTQQSLTFVIGSETYGVDILRVREIRGWSAVTKIPHAPPHVLGVLNLRGCIVPVIDLRMRFALECADYTKITVVIVLSVHSGAARHEVGVVVDGVSDVIDVSEADLHAPPELGPRSSTDYIRGLVTIANRMVVLLDIDRLIGIQLSDTSAAKPGQEPAMVAA